MGSKTMRSRPIVPNRASRHPIAPNCAGRRPIAPNRASRHLIAPNHVVVVQLHSIVQDVVNCAICTTITFLTLIHSQQGWAGDKVVKCCQVG